MGNKDFPSNGSMGLNFVSPEAMSAKVGNISTRDTSSSALCPCRPPGEEIIKGIRTDHSYGLNLCSEGFLRNWQENSFVKLVDYSDVHDIIPNHPESKFKGKIVAFNGRHTGSGIPKYMITPAGAQIIVATLPFQPSPNESEPLKT